jgi:hypothetical protein
MPEYLKYILPQLGILTIQKSLIHWLLPYRSRRGPVLKYRAPGTVYSGGNSWF